MKIPAVLIVSLACLLPLTAHSVERPGPVYLIFDTDIGNDCDDAMALAVIHALQNRGACQLVAVTLTNPDPLAGRMVDALNTFYGRGEIPIGVNPSAPAMAKPSSFLAVAHDYRHDFTPETAPSARSLLRRTLAEADDRSITIVQVGFFTNLAALLESPPDEFSPLSGRELVARKVRLLSSMAGAFATARGTNYYAQFNVKFDIPAAMKVTAAWPTPIVWSGVEIGDAILFPAVSIDSDFAYVARHPVRDCYQRFKPIPHERPCFDLTSVLQAVWPDRNYFELSAPGRIDILPDGFARYQAAKEGRDRFLIVDRTQAARLRELFSALVSEPPKLSR